MSQERRRAQPRSPEHGYLSQGGDKISPEKSEGPVEPGGGVSLFLSPRPPASQPDAFRTEQWRLRRKTRCPKPNSPTQSTRKWQWLHSPHPQPDSLRQNVVPASLGTGPQNMPENVTAQDPFIRVYVASGPKCFPLGR